MILQLHNEKYIEDIIMAMTEAEIEDPIVLSGESLGHKMLFDMPLFAGFRESMGDDKSFAKIITGFATEEQVEFMLKELKASGVKFQDDKLGKIVLLPIHKEY
jgi:hypothetical protein